jgi:hypothetical protein
MSRLVASIAVCLLAAACVSAPSARRVLSQDDSLIVPDRRIGEVYLRMPVEDLLRVMGAPVKTQPIADTTATTYSFDGIHVTADSRVYWIVVTSEQYRTAEGVGPGSEQIEVRAKHGKPKCAGTRGDSTTYDYKGQYFTVDNTTGKVTMVGVSDDFNHCDRSYRAASPSPRNPW